MALTAPADIWNGRQYTHAQMNVINEAVRRGLTSEEIEVFACVDSDGSPIHSAYEMQILFDVVLSFGVDSPQVDFIKRWDDAENFNLLLTIFYKALKSGTSVDYLKNFLPEEGKAALPPITIDAICRTAGREIDWSTAKRMIKQLNENDGKALPGMLPTFPTSLFIYRNCLASSSAFASLLNTAREENLPEQFLNYICLKDKTGSFAHSHLSLQKLLTKVAKLPKEELTFIDLKRPNGEFIFDVKTAAVIIKGMVKGKKAEDFSHFLVTDEAGNLLLTSKQIQNIISNVPSEEIDAYVSFCIEENDRIKNERKSSAR